MEYKELENEEPSPFAFVHMLEHLKTHLKGKVVILGIGNTLRSDDGAGSILARRINGKGAFKVFDAGPSPENYLEKIIKENPQTIVIADAVDFGGKPGEVRLLEGQNIETVNFFSTHNASISLAINYLQSRVAADIIILAIQPGTLVFGDTLSQSIEKTLTQLEDWFSRLTSGIAAG